MTRVDDLKRRVDSLYNETKEGTDLDWKPYLYAHHIFSVAEKAGEVAERFGANKELAMAAGMLHDVADAVLKRQDPRHGEESERIATELLRATGFNEVEIETIVNDAMRYHSCREGEQPATPEGKAMASGDAIVHLSSDFYDHAIEDWIHRGETRDRLKAWGLEKIDRDLNVKIFFPEVKEEVRADYERLKARFEALV